MFLTGSQAWKESGTIKTLQGFITALGDSVRGKSMTDEFPVSEVDNMFWIRNHRQKQDSFDPHDCLQAINKCVALLDEVDSWIDDIPPLEQVRVETMSTVCTSACGQSHSHGALQPQRFGNQAFRTWHTRLVDVTMYRLRCADKCHILAIWRSTQSFAAC